MSHLDGTIDFDQHEHTLDIVSHHVERFLEAWEKSSDAPRLSDFAPPQGQLRRLVLVELIKIDLEYRWQERNLPKRIVEYLAELPELAEGGVPVELIYEEFHIRRNCGFRVEVQDYLREFPQQADELLRLLGLNQPYTSTSMRDKGAKWQLEDIRPGETIEDFDLLVPLGEGNFAKVFLARQRSMQRMVALKISADSGSEPQTLAQFDHEYIVRVFDQRQDSSRNVRLLYMQYVAGGTLAHAVRLVRQTEPEKRSGEILVRAISQSLEKRGETLPAESALLKELRGLSWPQTVCWIGTRLARALDHAHRQGVLHRDLKPANVLLSAEGIPKLADFNISFCSKLAGATPDAYFGGSLAYMSPEQLEACDPAHPRAPDSLDGRSDLYSLGVVLWELLTGSRPFADDKIEGGWSQVMRAMLERRKNGISEAQLESLPADCPPGLARVLATCLKPEPSERYAGGEELSKQLDLCANARVQDMLHPPRKSLRAKSGPWGVLIIFLATAAPNILAGVFNYFYNFTTIIAELSEATQEKFDVIQKIINATAYPVGLGTLVALSWFVVSGYKAMQQGTFIPGDRLARLRWLALYLGHLCALVSVLFWTLAGFAYPISLSLTANEFSAQDSAHFFLSLLLCGLIAAAYPFFGVTYFCLRVLYPGLLRDDLTASDDTRALRHLSRLSIVYLAIGLSVPFLGIFLHVVSSTQSQLAVALVSGLGFAGFAVLFGLHRRLQSDLDALTRCLSPTE